MLNNISWASYALAISIFVLIYYSFVLILYYQHDLQNVFQKFKIRISTSTVIRKSITDKHAIDFTEAHSTEEDRESYLPELFLTLQTLIKNGSAKGFLKEELLFSLQLKLKQYPSLKDNINRERINHFIISECKNYCSIHLSGEEVSALWAK